MKRPTRLERRTNAARVYLNKQDVGAVTSAQMDHYYYAFRAGAAYECGYITRALRETEVDWRGALNRVHEEKRRLYNETLRLRALLAKNGIPTT